MHRISAGLFYKLFKAVSGTTLPPNAGDFRLLDRKAVNAMYRAITELASAVRAGRDREAAERTAAEALSAGGFEKIDYIVARDATTLKVPAPGVTSNLRVLAAAWLGKTRLIDNIPV